MKSKKKFLLLFLTPLFLLFLAAEDSYENNSDFHFFAVCSVKISFNNPNIDMLSNSTSEQKKIALKNTCSACCNESDHQFVINNFVEGQYQDTSLTFALSSNNNLLKNSPDSYNSTRAPPVSTYLNKLI